MTKIQHTLKIKKKKRKKEDALWRLIRLNSGGKWHRIDSGSFYYYF